MNPFVNPNKRGISLPSGCKDLIDVLKPSSPKQDDTVRRFIFLVLIQAQEDGATQLVIGVAPPNSGVPIRYQVKGTWYEMSPFPSHIRHDVIAELGRLAKLPSGQFPNQGTLDVTLGDFRLRWTV
jgi:hypothetical protein